MMQGAANDANEIVCVFGKCKHYLNCKKRKGKCDSYRPCKTYMDKYDNDMELWKEMHGE